VPSWVMRLWWFAGRVQVNLSWFQEFKKSEIAWEDLTKEVSHITLDLLGLQLFPSPGVLKEREKERERERERNVSENPSSVVGPSETANHNRWSTERSPIYETLCFLHSKGFWRWCVTLITTKLLDFVHRPDFFKSENTTFRKRDLFPSSGEGGALTLQKNQKLAFPQACGDKVQKLISNELCFLLSTKLDDVQSPETQ
jgi:hypothetical protein